MQNVGEAALVTRGILSPQKAKTLLNSKNKLFLAIPLLL